MWERALSSNREFPMAISQKTLAMTQMATWRSGHLVWQPGICQNCYPTLPQYHILPRYIKLIRKGAKMLVYLSINIQPELYEWIIFRSPILKYKCENVMFYVRWLKSWYKVQSIKFGSLSISGVQPSGKIGRFWGRTTPGKGLWWHPRDSTTTLLLT